ncbi:MAG TPA: hypothetical protein VE398_24275 [Acidobacteriota bacterium]|nr:hypothetical protein [Acidobacteriota bacterium]
MDRNDSKLVLRDLPILMWFLGLVFAGVGGLGFFQGGPPILLAFSAIGLAFLLFTSVLTITAVRVTRTLTLEYRSALLHRLKQISFDEIVGIGVERISSPKGFTYRVALKRKDGQVIPLRSSSSTGSGKKERQASQLRDFIGVPAFDTTPTGMAYAALASYIDKFHETNDVHWQIQPIAPARWHSPDFKIPGGFLIIAQKAENQASRGFLASLGSMFFKQMLSTHFHADETPGIDQAGILAPLDPELEPHFMAFTNAPPAACQVLNSRTVKVLAEWAGRYPIEMLHKSSSFGQLTVLFGPNGVYVSPSNPLQPGQVNELAALGVALVRSQGVSRSDSISA